MTRLSFLAPIALMLTGPAMAGDTHAHAQADAIQSPAQAATPAAFDILAAHAHRNGRLVTFHMTTNGVAGSQTPDAHGQLGGAPV